MAKSQTLTGYTGQLVDYISETIDRELDDEVLYSAKRCLIDTFAAMIGGAAQPECNKAEAAIALVRKAGTVPVPGRKSLFDMLDAVFLCGVASHALELDDGYRAGSAHPGTVVIPSVLPVSYASNSTGKELLRAVIAGYEMMTNVSAAVHPNLRMRGFHPTSAVGVLGAAMAVGTLKGLSQDRLIHSLGLAASAASGLFAFVNGGAEVKRLHPGHAAREGAFAVLLAEQGMTGPPAILEGSNGFFQAFASQETTGSVFTPGNRLGVMDCYMKPYPCCRHLHPSVDALIQILEKEQIATEDVEAIHVETYSIATQHASVGWDNVANAQLSFPYVMAVALRRRKVTLEYFTPSALTDTTTINLCSLLEVKATDEMDDAYPNSRPARVIVVAGGKEYSLRVDEALGAPQLPLSDDALGSKFTSLVVPSLGKVKSEKLLSQLWNVDQLDDVAPILLAAIR